MFSESDMLQKAPAPSTGEDWTALLASLDDSPQLPARLSALPARLHALPTAPPHNQAAITARLLQLAASDRIEV